jgi:hypothetical protein
LGINYSIYFQEQHKDPYQIVDNSVFRFQQRMNRGVLQVAMEEFNSVINVIWSLEALEHDVIVSQVKQGDQKLWELVPIQDEMSDFFVVTTLETCILQFRIAH